MDRNFGLSPQDQIKVMTCLPKIPALLSMAGSFGIMYSVLKDKVKRASGYHRLCLGMSLSDFLASFWLFLSSWPVPVEDKYSYMNYGNRQTCTAQGFFIQLGITTPLYNLSLCIHLMISVCYKWGRQRKYQRKAEIMLHVFAWVVGIGTASTGLALELYNSVHTLCWINEYPSGCNRFPHVDCIRAEKSTLYRWLFYVAPFGVWFVVCFVALFRVFRFVYSQDRKMDDKILRSDAWHSKSKNSTTTGSSSLRQQDVQQRRKSFVDSMNLSHTKMLAWSIFSYVLAFFATWLPMLIQILQVYVRGRPTFLAIATMFFFWPMQGFINFLVYSKAIESLGIGSFLLSCFKRCFMKAGDVSPDERRLSFGPSVLAAIKDLSDVANDDKDSDPFTPTFDMNCTTTRANNHSSAYQMDVATDNFRIQNTEPLQLAGYGSDCRRLSIVECDSKDNSDTGECTEEVLDTKLVKTNTKPISDENNITSQPSNDSDTTTTDKSFSVCSNPTSSMEVIQEYWPTQETIRNVAEGDKIKTAIKETSVLDEHTYNFVDHQRQIEEALDKELESFRDMMKISSVSEGCVIDDQ